MPLYRIKQGDCLSSITASFGFADWQTIYNHPSNADFRTSRPDPNVLYPGDVLFIPDRDPGVQHCQTEIRHHFVLKRQPTFINLRLQDVANQPIAAASYKLTLGAVEIEGTTDPDGWIRSKIPALAQNGTLIVWTDPDDPDEFLQYPVLLGSLDPLETTTGVKGRLKNLGYYRGQVDEQKGTDYDSAVRRFQQDHALAVDGIAGPKTHQMLEQLHQK